MYGTRLDLHSFLKHLQEEAPEGTQKWDWQAELTTVKPRKTTARPQRNEPAASTPQNANCRLALDI